MALEKMIGGTVEKDYSLRRLADMIYRAKNFTSSRFTSLTAIPLLSSSVPPHRPSRRPCTASRPLSHDHPHHDRGRQTQ